MSRSAPDGPPAAGSAGEGPTALRYPDAEWRLLVQLPGHVLTAALAGQPDDPGIRVHSAVAGLEAIAAGRLFDSDLVRAVANAIYAESGAPERASAGTGGGHDTDSSRGGGGHDADGGGGGHGAGGEAGAYGGGSDVLAACRAAVKVLRQHTDPADSAGYRQWVQSVAARTAGPASSLVADLGRALGLVAGI